MYSIYTLADPRNMIIRYVGLSNNAPQRYAFHLASLGKTGKDQWVQSLLQSGLMPVLTVIDTTETKDQAKEREKFWIRHYISLQTPLFNVQNTPTDATSHQGLETELRQLLTEHGWTLHKRTTKSGKEYFYAIKWKRDQVYITSGRKLATVTREDVLKKINVA